MIASLLVLSVASALADRPAPSYAPAPAPSYDEPASYSYSWAVKDDYSKNDYGQNEKREGKSTSGSYSVLLPDGRTQTVTYSVDGYGGICISECILCLSNHLNSCFYSGS